VPLCCMYGTLVGLNCENAGMTVSRWKKLGGEGAVGLCEGPAGAPGVWALA
jgi:hypothetical protein